MVLYYANMDNPLSLRIGRMNVADPINRARGLLATFGRLTAVDAVGNGLLKATFTSPVECQRVKVAPGG